MLNLRHIYQQETQDFLQRLKEATKLDSREDALIRALYGPTINRYFSHIFVLNLDKRPDRWHHMQRELHRLGITRYSRFTALDGLNGNNGSHFKEWQQYHKVPITKTERLKYQRKGIASAGSWAILKSMYLMIREAQERKLSNFLVLQDDMLVHRDFHQNFDTVIKSLPQWKLFYLGATQHLWGHCSFDRSQRFYFAHGSADGAFAVAIDHSIYEEVINEILKFDLPIDAGALKTIQRRYPKLTPIMYPNIIIADIRDSDLRGYRNLEQFSQKFRWNLKDYYVVDKIRASVGTAEALNKIAID